MATSTISMRPKFKIYKNPNSYANDVFGVSRWGHEEMPLMRVSDVSLRPGVELEADVELDTLWRSFAELFVELLWNPLG